MRKFYLFNWMLLLIGLISSTALGQTTTYTYTFSKIVYDGKDQTQPLGDINWLLVDNGGYYGYNSDKGQQVGSGGNPAKSMSLSTDEISGQITSIKVSTSGASSIVAKLKVRVGGADFDTERSITTNNTEYSFNGNANGNIELIWNQTSSKALYIKKIEVTYELPTADEPPVITPMSFTGKVGDSGDYTVAVTNNPTDWTQETDLLPAGITFTDGVFSGTYTQAGTFSAVLTATNDAGTSADATFTWEIAKGDQTLTLANQNLVLGSADVTLPATTEQGFAVTYTSADSAIASVSGNTLSAVALGSTSITVTATGDANYEDFSTTFDVVVSDAPIVYNGQGTFEKITSVDDLTDGYYMITDANDEVIATNTLVGGTYVTTELILTDNKIIDPETTTVWYIASDGNNYTIQSSDNNKYFAYNSSTNLKVSDAVSGDNEKWNISYSTVFTVSSVADPSRILKYNSSLATPGFKAYTASSQLPEVSLYKLQGPATQVATPTITVTGVENGVDTYFNTANITLATTTDGATIYYTTDGTEPSTTSTVYTTSFDITATATIKAIAVAADLDDSFVAEKTITIIEPASAAIPYEEAFDNTLGDWITYNAEGTITTWSASTYGATVNGYNNGAADAWLISPKLTSGAASLDLVFDYDSTYGAGDLLVKYSINYTGYGDPSLATWQDLPVITHTNNGSTKVNGSYSEILTTTGDIHLAFVYQQSSDWVRWNIRDLMIDIAPTSAIVWTTSDEWSNVTGPTINDDVVIEGDLFVGTDVASFEAKTLTVVSGGAVYIESGNSVTVAGAIDNQAGADNFIVASGANLIQVQDVANTGEFTVYRNSNPMVRNDMTLWSSPVANQSLRAFSPETLYNRFWTYNEGTNAYQALFTAETQDQDFENGRGYAIRVKNTLPTGETTVHEGVFVGNLNNGNVAVNTVAAYSGNNLVGNPYSSNIAVQGTNGFLAANADVNAIYFWTQTYPVGSPNYNNNYQAYSLAGSTLGDVENISVGQGFIVNVDNPGQVVFNNAMRTSDASTFYRTEIEKNRMWLSLTKDEEKLNQILVAYMTDATNELDHQIDAKVFAKGQASIYTLINAEAYAIQGRALPFDQEDVVALGFEATEQGTYSINIEAVDGLFAEGQEVYLLDKTANKIHDLTTAYTFESEAGIFDERFEVVYANRDLGLNTDLTNSKDVVVYTDNNTIVVESKNATLLSVELIDLQGRTVAAKNNIKANTYRVNTSAKGVLVVKIQTADGNVITKKVIRK